MAKNYNNNYFYQNILSHSQSLPKYKNMLDNFNTIYYRGSIMPRIWLNPSNSKKEECLTIKDITYNNLIERKDDINNRNQMKKIEIKEDNIYPKEKMLVNEGEKDNLMILIDNNIKNCFEINNNIINENHDLNNDFFKGRKNIDPIPPMYNNRSSINEENIKNTKLYNNNFDNSNNLFLNYIDSSHHNIILPNNNILFPIINPIYIQANINYNTFTNNIVPNNENSCKIRSKIKKGKPIFGLSTDPINIAFKKKRGRKPKHLSNQRIHKGSDDDNLLRKIQVHFLSFIINYSNDIIKAFIEHNNQIPLFKMLDYKIKKIANHKYIDELKNKKICDILQLRVSPKMKIHGETVNKQIYSKICTMFPFLTNFFEKTCQNVFREYYFGKSKLFEVNGKIIPFSKKTKTFSDLIIKNYKFRENLKKVANKNYLNDIKIPEKNNYNSHDINVNQANINNK